MGQFQKALDLQSGLVPSWVYLALLLLRKGRADDAIREAKAALSQDPENASAHNVLGSAYLSKGNHAEGLAELNKALALDPSLADVHLKKALVALKGGKGLEAESELSTALRIKPEAQEARLTLALYYINTNELAKAIDVLKKGLRGGREDAVLQLPAGALRRLRQVRDEHKLRLCYLVGTHRELTQLARRRTAPEEAIGKFTELFDEDTYPLTPYSHAGAHDMLLRKTFDWHQRLTPEDEDRLYRLTGGHAKLLAAVLRLWEDHRYLPWSSVEHAAQQDRHLRDLCAAIWDDLEPIERFALAALVNDRRAGLQPGELDSLRRKGLIVGHPPGIFSMIFEEFVKTQGPITRPDQPARSSRLRDLGTNSQW